MPATTLQLRRGTTAQHATFTGRSGEVTVDTTRKALVVHDGATAGGTPAARMSDVSAAQAAATSAAILMAAPPSAVMLFPLAAPPAGWLKANGAAVLVSAYPDLASILYCGDANNATALSGYRATSASSPSTNRSLTGQYIVLPDLRGEFLRCWDDTRGLDSGRALNSVQAQSTQNHYHRLPFGWDPSLFYAWNEGSSLPIFGSDVEVSASRFSFATGGSGGSARIARSDSIAQGFSGETRPRNVALLACIKF